VWLISRRREDFPNSVAVRIDAEGLRLGRARLRAEDAILRAPAPVVRGDTVTLDILPERAIAA